MSTDMERELERTTEMRGFRYGLHDFVAQLAGPEALAAHNDNTQANYLKEGLIGPERPKSCSLWWLAWRPGTWFPTSKFTCTPPIKRGQVPRKSWPFWTWWAAGLAA